jgi:hypothetical protein
MTFKHALDDFGAPPGTRSIPAVQAYMLNTLDALAGVGASERRVVLELPSGHGCVAGRRLAISPHAPRGMRIRSVTRDDHRLSDQHDYFNCVRR